MSYEELCRHPAGFPTPTGVARREFDALLARFAQAAAGRRHAHGPADRLLMALVWLRV